MNIVDQIKDKLKDEIKASVMKAGLAEEAQIPEVILELPKDKAHGDYSTNMAMQLARVAKKLLEQLQKQLSKTLINRKLPLRRLRLLVLDLLISI